MSKLTKITKSLIVNPSVKFPTDSSLKGSQNVTDKISSDGNDAFSGCIKSIKGIKNGTTICCSINVESVMCGCVEFLL